MLLNQLFDALQLAHSSKFFPVVQLNKQTTGHENFGVRPHNLKEATILFSNFLIGQRNCLYA